MQKACVVVCLVSVVATLTLPPLGSHYPRRPPPQRHPPTWQRTHHTTRRPALQETPRKGLKPGDKKNLSIGVVLPYSTFHRRSYVKAIKSALFSMQRDTTLQQTFKYYHFTYDEVVLITMHHSSSPTNCLVRPPSSDRHRQQRLVRSRQHVALNQVSLRRD